MNVITLFEHATRNKFRFESSHGSLSAEQLWDVPLRSNDDFNLNAIAKKIDKAHKEATEVNFVETKKSAAHEYLEMRLEVVKRVIEVKLEEEAKAKKKADSKKEREVLLEILAKKQLGKLDDLSEKELQKRINALTD